MPFRATTQGTFSKPTFKVSPKPCRPRTSKANKSQALPLHYRLVLVQSHQAKLASKPPGEGHVQPCAKRLEEHWCCRHHLARPPSPLGATRSSAPYPRTVLVFKHTKQIATPNLGIQTNSNIYQVNCLNSHGFSFPPIFLFLFRFTNPRILIIWVASD